MKLLVKFNLVFLLVFLVGLAASSMIARNLLKQAAQDEVTDRARLLMQHANAVSSYTAEEIKPLLATQMNYTFLPQSVPAFSAAEVLGKLQKDYPEYAFKSAMLNPTNPRDRAVSWEADIITQFKQTPDLKEFIGERETPTGTSLYIARPIRITNPVCLSCHSTPDAAPKTLIDKYGPANGFGWTLNDTLGVQVVSVPMTLPMRQADHALLVVMGVLTGVFLLIGAALNFMLYRLVIRPVSRLSGIADRVSLGEFEAPEFEVRSKDEIGTLSASFNRMRTSLAHAMKMLDA
ncbi:MAG: c-type heme family protein [Burkholderiaceae bacterium]